MKHRCIIKTEKGYICEANASGTYGRGNEFYREETGKWFSTINASCDGVDKLGFTNNEKEATRYASPYVGERIKEIINRIDFGFEPIKHIEIVIADEIK